MRPKSRLKRAKAPKCCCSTWHRAPDGESPLQNAGGVFWARQPDEHTGVQQVHRDLASPRRVHPAAQSDPVRLGALVHRGNRSDRDGKAENNPRFLRLPASAVRRPVPGAGRSTACGSRDRKSTRLNSSHSQISYAVFCLKKKNTNIILRDAI